MQKLKLESCLEAQVKGMVPIKLSLLSWHLVTPVPWDSFF